MEPGNLGGHHRGGVGGGGLRLLERGEHAGFHLAQFAAQRGDGGGLCLVGHLLGIAAHTLDALGHQPFGALDAVDHVGKPTFEARQHRRGAQYVIAAGRAVVLGEVRHAVLHGLERVAGALLAAFNVFHHLADGVLERGVAGHVLGALIAAGAAELRDLAGKNGEPVVDGGQRLNRLAFVFLDASDDPLQCLAFDRGTALLRLRGRVALALGKVGQLLGDVLQAQRVIVTALGTGRGRARADVGTGRFWGQRRRGHEVFPWVRISLFTNIMRALIENHAI